MDHSLSRGSIKARKLGMLNTLIIWFQARADASQHKRGSLPLGMLEPGIARVCHWVETRNQRLAAISLHYWHTIPVAIFQAEAALARPEAELAKRQRALEEVIGRYKADHDGMEPPEHSAPFGARASFWVVGGLFTIGEWPLMSAALERLPGPDWQRFILAAGASGVTIYLSHEIGVWLAKPHKTLAQTMVSWLLVAVLFAILTSAAIVRRGSMQNHKNSPTPQVYIRDLKGERNLYV